MVWHFMPFAITFSTAYGQNIIRCTKFCATIVLGTSSYVFMKEAIGADANQSVFPPVIIPYGHSTPLPIHF